MDDSVRLRDHLRHGFSDRTGEDKSTAMNDKKYWGLSSKLAMIGVPFLILVLILTAATLWVSWQLDGGAAAVNEAGRMRMQSYRMALGVGTQQTQELEKQISEFNDSMKVMREGVHRFLGHGQRCGWGRLISFCRWWRWRVAWHWRNARWWWACC